MQTFEKTGVELRNEHTHMDKKNAHKQQINVRKTFSTDRIDCKENKKNIIIYFSRCFIFNFVT